MDFPYTSHVTVELLYNIAVKGYLILRIVLLVSPQGLLGIQNVIAPQLRNYKTKVELTEF